MEHNEFPSAADVEQELSRERYVLRYKRTLKSTVFALITAAAAAVLVATLWLPVLQIFGSSMTPTLEAGQIVVIEKRSILFAYFRKKTHVSLKKSVLFCNQLG